jgi:peptide deformylase
MAKLEILEMPDPRLRTVAKPVEQFDEQLAQLVDDMIETMYDAKGIGLAATQVNVHRRLLVLDVSEAQDTPREYINPEITETVGTETCEEGCLSVPGIYADVSRAETVRVKAFDRHGKPFEETLDGMHAVCLQHEMDHLQGKLFVDYLSPLKRRIVLKKLEKAKKQSEKNAKKARL